MNALADPEVGKYLNEHCVCTFQKVGTFKIVNGQKQGGNVASYFCLGDGSVLDAIAGPVDAATFLREARWVVETRKMAIFDSHNDAVRYREFFRKAHMDRLKAEYGVNLAAATPTRGRTTATRIDTTAASRVPLTSWQNSRGLDNQGKIHLLLAQQPLAKLPQIYKYVFEKILNEKVSTLPVQTAG